MFVLNLSACTASYVSTKGSGGPLQCAHVAMSVGHSTRRKVLEARSWSNPTFSVAMLDVVSLICRPRHMLLLQAMQHLAAARAGLATMVRIDHVRCSVTSVNNISSLSSIFHLQSLRLAVIRPA